MQTRERGSRIQWPGRSFLETKQVYLTYLGTPVPIPPSIPPPTLVPPAASSLRRICPANFFLSTSHQIRFFFFFFLFFAYSTIFPLSLSLFSFDFISSQLVVSSYPNSSSIRFSFVLSHSREHGSLLAPVLAITSSFPKVPDRLTTIGIVRVYGRTWYVVITKKGLRNLLLS